MSTKKKITTDFGSINWRWLKLLSYPLKKAETTLLWKFL
jgi:hypothetical protein